MKMPINLLVLLFSGLILAFDVQAQDCPSAQGDEVAYGNGKWRGYVYDESNNFSSNNYQGYIEANEQFDQSFCGNNCMFPTNGCDVSTESFSIKYKMQQYFPAGVYRFVVGGDDGVRLSIDGGATYLINEYVAQSYTTYEVFKCLAAGTYDLVLDYYENYGENRVGFRYDFYGQLYGGEIGNSQTFCQSSEVDPAAFTILKDPFSCNGSTFAYQWQVSTDNVNWIDIAGATNAEYDIPSGATGLKYYRRQVTDGTSTAYSNTLTVQANVPGGDESLYGEESWIGHVYEGTGNFESSNYVGQITESKIFDENFGGDNVTISTTGCDIEATTFSVRFKMKMNLPHGRYTFTIGGDDGMRLSLDGGNTFAINDYSDHSYRSVSTTETLSGDVYLVLDYYENAVANRVTFDYVLDELLPVTLVNFTGSWEKGRVKLSWSTASEINNDHFLIQRSLNGVDFETIGRKKGWGNSLETHRYHHTDLHAGMGHNYYRLVQVDFDGTTTYSNIISVLNPLKGNFKIYPIPVKDYAIINPLELSRESIDVVVFSLSGKLLKTECLTVAKNWKLDLRGFKAGIYLLKLTVGESIMYKRIAISH